MSRSEKAMAQKTKFVRKAYFRRNKAFLSHIADRNGDEDAVVPSTVNLYMNSKPVFSGSLTAALWIKRRRNGKERLSKID